MEVFVARQPIFNSKEEVFAYELLYRNNQVNAFPAIDEDQATAEVIINSFLNIGIDQLSEGKPCFINFTEKLLKLRVPAYFRPREIVVEILETVKPSAELVRICKDLKELGYQIALDDYVFNETNPFARQLLKYADIIKVDFLNTPKEMREKIELLVSQLRIKTVAEKVETREEYEEAKSKGYDYFQGYFFEKPVIMSTHDVPAYFQSYYEMIQNLSKEEPSLDRIAELIERDISLSYKLLRLINSPAYRPKQKINSIRQAIVLLGLIELEKWIYVLAVRENIVHHSQMAEETIRLSMRRAKMCEEIGRLQIGKSVSSSYFMTGMFSLMDSLLNIPMKQILDELPLQDDICEALRGENNHLKVILDLAVAVEKAQWSRISEMCEKLNVDEKTIFKIYSEALAWSSQLLKPQGL
ncbi:EAL and HDOD domain-containing protein [Cytobacillus firmus]|uniref:HDOD domain-containing protein n=1 Tax=Cytobacillus firmus TaxID=1399 RepID=A0AA46P1H0_CYTFI|nr:HDOD domain-containing protein [Cytobacillus firmus]MCS0653821.1 HDOD domain-containing protein [Cytobacillus firmus]UYG94952.1 HDOD domain-containing protein [Cytobacillus firmus]